MSAMVKCVSSEGSAEVDADLTLILARKQFSELEEWVLSPEAQEAPLDAVEQEIERRTREVARLALQANVNRRGTGYHGRALVVTGPSGDRRRQIGKREDTRHVVSLFGEISAVRTAYIARGTATVHPLDAALQLPQKSLSYAMQRRLVDEAVRGPFDEAVAAVEKNTGNAIAKRTAEQVTVDKARDFDAFYEQRTAPAAESTGPLLVSALDCKGVPVVKPGGTQHSVRRKKGEKANKKKMATVAAVFTQQRRIRTAEDVVASLFDDIPVPATARVRPEHKRVWASLEKEQEAVFREVAAEIAARDPLGQKEHIMVTDGERRLRKAALKTFPDVLLVLDLLHVLEYLWKTAHAFYGEGSPEAEAWVRNHALMILQGRVSQVVKGMRQSATKRKLTGARRKTVLGAAAYFYANRDRMRYHEYLARGLPIASGAVEGACKNLIKDRMERSGMRWQIPGAEAMIKLRAIYLSGDMDQYWQFHKQQEQSRLYGQQHWRAAS